MHVDKRIDLVLLEQELAAAGVAVAGLGLTGTDTDAELYTYDGIEPADLPPEAVPVVEAHDAGRQGRAFAFEADEDAERLALVAARSAEDPAFAALAELTLKGG